MLRIVPAQANIPSRPSGEFGMSSSNEMKARKSGSTVRGCGIAGHHYPRLPLCGSQSASAFEKRICPRVPFRCGTGVRKKAGTKKPGRTNDGVKQYAQQQHPVGRFARAQGHTPTHELLEPVGGEVLISRHETAKPTSTVVQPAQAGARLMSVPQISGMQYGRAIKPPNCSIRSNSGFFPELKVSAAEITRMPRRKVTILLTINISFSGACGRMRTW